MIQAAEKSISKCQGDGYYDPIIARVNERMIAEKQDKIERYWQEIFRLEQKLRFPIALK